MSERDGLVACAVLIGGRAAIVKFRDDVKLSDSAKRAIKRLLGPGFQQHTIEGREFLFHTKNINGLTLLCVMEDNETIFVPEGQINWLLNEMEKEWMRIFTERSAEGGVGIIAILADFEPVLIKLMQFATSFRGSEDVKRHLEQIQAERKEREEKEREEEQKKRALEIELEEKRKEEERARREEERKRREEEERRRIEEEEERRRREEEMRRREEVEREKVRKEAEREKVKEEEERRKELERETLEESALEEEQRIEDSLQDLVEDEDDTPRPTIALQPTIAQDPFLDLMGPPVVYSGPPPSYPTPEAAVLKPLRAPISTPYPVVYSGPPHFPSSGIAGSGYPQRSSSITSISQLSISRPDFPSITPTTTSTITSGLVPFPTSLPAPSPFPTTPPPVQSSKPLPPPPVQSSRPPVQSSRPPVQTSKPTAAAIRRPTSTAKAERKPLPSPPLSTRLEGDSLAEDESKAKRRSSRREERPEPKYKKSKKDEEPMPEVAASIPELTPTAETAAAGPLGPPIDQSEADILPEAEVSKGSDLGDKEEEEEADEVPYEKEKQQRDIEMDVKKPSPKQDRKDVDVEKGDHKEYEGDKIKRKEEIQKQIDQVKDVAHRNIAQVIDRAERLDELVMKSEELSDKSMIFYQRAKRQRQIQTAKLACFYCMCCPCVTLYVVGTQCVACGRHLIEKRKAARKKQQESTKVDDIFADMENVFNGLSAWIVGCEPSRACVNVGNFCTAFCCYLARIPTFLMSLLFISGFSFTIMLPTCFLLLVLRTKTIERKVETGFAVRQQVLAKESKKQKSVRFLSLLFRALPMLGLLLAWPIVSVYVLIPMFHASSTVVGLTVGLYITVILVLQGLGTMRSIKSFQKKKEAEAEDRVAEAQKAAVLEEHEDFQLDFRWKNVGNVLAVISLLVETLQLATFSMQTLAPDANPPKDETPPPAPPSQGGYISTTIIPALYISVSGYLKNNVHKVYAWVGISVTIILIGLFIIQFLKELRTFGRLKREEKKDEANKYFFHSFVGSIVYGHGELEGVSPKISLIAGLLSDTLFMVVCGKLLLVITCIERAGEPVLMINSQVVCWEGEHMLLAVLSLIAFGFYLPLSTMIAPMLVETKTELGKDGKPKKDVNFVKPFLSMIVVSKCVLLVAGTFFGKDDPVTTVVSSGLIFVVLFLLSSYWAMQPSVLQDKYGLGEPCWPPFINVWRCLIFAGGALGSIVAIIAQKNPDTFSGDAKFVLLFAFLFMLYVAGYVWYKRWRQRVVKLEHEAKRVADSEREAKEQELNTKVVTFANGVWSWN